ncbi:MAG TPA: hypothetical protein PKA90_07605 [Ignavibacteria bacterium]|nr:hypothetical protein [Ignavibacteria bacterium]HMR40282.1 hypothetical protein [Ignavibacteria bacterium]
MIKEKRDPKKMKKKETELKIIEDFKSVEWVRKIRDKMYEENKNLNMKDYVKNILKKKNNS